MSRKKPLPKYKICSHSDCPHGDKLLLANKYFAGVRDGGKGTPITRWLSWCYACDKRVKEEIDKCSKYNGMSRTKFRALPKDERQRLRNAYDAYRQNFVLDPKTKIEDLDPEELMRIIVHSERKKHNNQQISRDQIPYGFVYGVINPADHWKGWVKAGRAGISGERLNGYQTADHRKGFELLHKVLVIDRFGAEEEILALFRDEGYEVLDEWIRVDQKVFVSVLNSIAETPEYNANGIMDEYRQWKERRAA